MYACTTLTLCVYVIWNMQLIRSFVASRTQQKKMAGNAQKTRMENQSRITSFFEKDEKDFSIQAIKKEKENVFVKALKRKLNEDSLPSSIHNAARNDKVFGSKKIWWDVSFFNSN